MEDHLNLGLKLSLEEMAVRRLVASLWDDMAILTSSAFQTYDTSLPKNYGFTSYTPKGYAEASQPATVEIKIKDKILRLRLPISLKKRMAHLVRPIGLDLLEWYIYHKNILNITTEHIGVSILKQLCWTSAGAVDYLKTAEKLVYMNLLDAVNRYKLACLYCMLDIIPVLWEKLPEEVREEYTERAEKGPIIDRNCQLEYYWAYVLNGEQNDLSSIALKSSSRASSFHPLAFETSAFQGNRAATEYFYQLLPSEKRNSLLFRTIHFVIAERCRNPLRRRFDFSEKKLSEVLCYLFSLMSYDHQIQVLKERPSEVLCCFLDWPLQDFFLDVADISWTCIPHSEYKNLIKHLTMIITNSGYYFPDLIQNFFLRSPVEFREHFLDQIDFFFDLSYAEDPETLRVVLQNMNVEASLQMVTTHWYVKLVRYFVHREKWHMIKICFREASLPKEKLNNLRQFFMRFYPKMIPMMRSMIGDDRLINIRSKWKQFFVLLDEFVESDSQK